MTMAKLPRNTAELAFSLLFRHSALGETRKPPDPYFASKIGSLGLEVSEFLTKLYYLIGKSYKLAYFQPRTFTKMFPI